MPKKQYSEHYEGLKNKWSDRHRELQKIILEKHEEAKDWVDKSSKNLVAATLAGMILLTSPALTQLPSSSSSAKEKQFSKLDDKVFLISDLAVELPERVETLTHAQEDVVAQTLTRHFNIRVTPELEGIRLNRSYGYIGAEQHLARFPGDNMATHFNTAEEEQAFTASGMAPGLGAWGYFAKSEAEMTTLDLEREKYYIAVQTFLAPGWDENVRTYSQFFKYRKMLVVNPDNGRGIVVVIGDAGPAEWTGKHLGGSPEVMKYLERVDGRNKGAVLYLFINDPFDKVPLGPIELSS